MDNRPDNSLHPLTRVSYLPLAFLTAIFGPVLVLFPGSTEDYWSWPIHPDLSAVWVGAAFTFGAVAIVTMLVRGRWTEAIVPVTSTLAFAIVILAATLIHHDRFFVGRVSYYVWLAIYVYLPISLPLMLLLNRSRDPGVQPGEMLLSARLRLLLGTAGALITVYSLALILGVDRALDLWPWPLAPLMAKVVGAWLLFLGAGGLCATFERRYAAYRFYFPEASFWFALLFCAALANDGDFDAGAAEPVFLVVLAAAAIGALAIFLLLERKAGRALARA